ncbi:MAG: IS4 family transposase, partial [Bacteroidota bacterium]
TLADANEHRSWQIYRDVAVALINRARRLYQNDKLLADLESAVYAFDSTIIELCLALFPWAQAKGHVKTSAGIKMHTLLDLASNMPTVIRVSAASVHDVLMLDELVYEAGAYYVLDRGYMDFARLKRIDNSGAYFVIRARRDLRFRRVYSQPVIKTSGVIADQTITFTVWRTHDVYPDHLRRIRFFDAEHDRTLVFLTNNFLLDALTVAQLYRARWQIELFFKWIKQHLRIKGFYGTTPNAVKTQIWIAVAIYVLVAILKKELKLDQSLYTILQILSVTLFQKEPMYQVLADTRYNIQNTSGSNQLILFNF